MNAQKRTVRACGVKKSAERLIRVGRGNVSTRPLWEWLPDAHPGRSTVIPNILAGANPYQGFNDSSPASVQA